MSEFHFLRLEWFWAILPLVGLILWWHLRKLYKGNWRQVVDPQLQEYVLTGSESKSSYWSSGLFFIAGLLAITAMAGPAWERLPMPVFKDESAMVIALDLSRSMDAQDIQPSRLQRARLKLIDILRQRKTGQSALIVYAANAFTVTPLTDDIETIIAHVPNLSTDMMPNQGSRADRAIEKAIELFEQTGIKSGQVLLITDEADISQLKQANKKLLVTGHSLLILGVGSPAGAPIPEQGGGFVKDITGSIIIARLNEAELRSIAPYQHMSYDDRDINALFTQQELDPLSIQARRTELNSDTWRDQGPWLLLPVLLIALLGFRRGLLVLACLCLLPIPQPAMALDWQSLWLNDNQRGIQALQNEQAEQAAKLFDDAEWKAAAQYRAGAYEEALASLENITTPEALYNKGNALAKLGRVAEAIEAYNKVLATNPDHEDAKYNRDLLQQQQSDQSQQNSEQNQDSDSQQQEQNSSEQDSEQNQDSQQQNSDSQQQESSNSEQNSEQHQDSQQQQADQQNQSEQTDEAQESKQQQAQQSEEQNQEEKDEQASATPRPAEEAEADAEQQAIEQWLRRIPDDPGGLLRRKFLHQYRQQKSDREDKQW